MSTTQVILLVLRCGDAFGLLPEPYSKNMLSRHKVRSFIRQGLWNEQDDM